MIQSNTVSVSVKQDFKLNGGVIVNTTKVTFSKSFSNTPVVDLSINGWSKDLIRQKIKVNLGITTIDIDNFIVNFDVKAGNITPSGFDIVVDMKVLSYQPPISSQNFHIDYPNVMTVSWLAYNEVTIGA